MGISAGGLIHGRGGPCGLKKCERNARHSETECKSLHKKTRKMYQITHLFTHLRKFVPKIVIPLFKNRNKRYHTDGLMRGGLI